MSPRKLRSAGVWTILTLVWLMVPGVLPGQVKAPPPFTRGAAEQGKLDTRVYTLHHLAATDAVRILRELFSAGTGARPNMTLSTDDRSNALIVAASADDQATIEALLGKLDTKPALDREDAKLRAFVLKHRDTDATIEAALRMLFDKRPSARFHMDRAHRSVLVYGDTESQVLAEAVLNLLDQPPAARVQAASTDTQLRLFWLVSGPPREEASLPDELKSLSAELNRLGMHRPRPATQLMVNAVPQAAFEITGLATQVAPCRIVAGGVLNERSDRSGLEIKITVSRVASGQDAGVLCRLNTKATLSAEGPSILGVLPTENLGEGVRSAFVVLAQQHKRVTATAKRYSFELRNAPWSKVLEWLSDQTGLPITSTHKIAGTFTFVSPKPQKQYTIPEIIDILNEGLREHKVFLMRQDRAIAVVPSDSVLDTSIVPRVELADLDKHGRTELVQIVFSLKHVLAKDIAGDVKKMLSPLGEAIPLERSNTLLVQDTVGNLHRVRQTLQSADDRQP